MDFPNNPQNDPQNYSTSYANPQQSYSFQPPFLAFYEDKRKIRKTSNGIGITLLIMMVCMFLFASVNALYLKLIGYQGVNIDSEFKGFTPILYYLNVGTVYLLSLFLPFAVYLLICKTRFSEVLPFERVSAGIAIPCIFLGMGVCILANIPANFVAQFLEIIGFPYKMPSYPLNDDPIVNLLFFVNVAIIPPLVEEFVFRGVILGRLRKYGNTIAIIGSAILFGLFHGNFIQIPFAFIVGLIFGIIIIRTNNIWITVIIHFLNNSFSASQELLQRYVNETVVTAINQFAPLLFIVLGIASTIFLAIKNKHFFLSKFKAPVPFSISFGAFLSNPGIILLILACLTEAVLSLYR